MISLPHICCIFVVHVHPVCSNRKEQKNGNWKISCLDNKFTILKKFTTYQLSLVCVVGLKKKSFAQYISLS